MATVWELVQIWTGWLESPDIPELKFSPVEFDADKFTADVMADPPPRKRGDSDANPEGEWVDGNKPGDQAENPEMKDGEGLPDTGKKKEDLKKLPDEQKYMRALDEMSKLEKVDPKATYAVVDAKAKKVKSKYGLDKIQLKNKKDDSVDVYVKHAKEDNGKHLLTVPLMSEAERMKLLKTAMDDLTKRSDKAAGEEGTIEESAAKDMLSAWHKEHPVVEEARVVDGGETWDYFIDIGDKSETEKGKLKLEVEEIDGEVEGEDKRTDEEKQKALQDGLKAAVEFSKKQENGLEEIDNQIPKIKSTYQMQLLKYVVEEQEDDNIRIHFEAKVNPEGDSPPVDVAPSEAPDKMVKIDALLTGVSISDLKEFLKKKMIALWDKEEEFRNTPTVAKFLQLAIPSERGVKLIHQTPLNKGQNKGPDKFSDQIIDKAEDKLDNDPVLKKYSRSDSANKWLEGKKSTDSRTR